MALFVTSIPIHSAGPAAGKRLWPLCHCPFSSSFCFASTIINSPFQVRPVHMSAREPPAFQSFPDDDDNRVRSSSSSSYSTNLNANNNSNRSTVDKQSGRTYAPEYDEYNDFVGSEGIHSPELDALLGPDASEDDIIAQNRLLFPEDPAFKIMDETDKVTINLPLGAAFEELPSGEIFIDEIMEDSNVEKSGLLNVGDVIVGYSLPFGEDMTSLPTHGALDVLEKAVKEREKDWISFLVRRGGNVEDMRRQVIDDMQGQLTEEQVEEINRLASDTWYPFVEEDDEQDDGPKTIEDSIAELRKEGVDMDVDVGYTPIADEIEHIEKEAEADIKWADFNDDKYEDEDDGEDDEGLPKVDVEIDEDLNEAIEHWREVYNRGQQRKAENN